MSTVCIQATLADGTILIGPVHGNGGMLGNSSLFAGAWIARQAAFDQIWRAHRRAEEGRDSGLFEPVPGHVAIFPDHCADSDGASIAVPLVGTRFEV